MHKARIRKVLCLTLVLSVTLFMTFAITLTAQVMAAPQDLSSQAIQNSQDAGLQPVYYNERCERARHHCHRHCEGRDNYHHCVRHCMREHDCD